ncbi:MAG: DNA topoisomerase, partial [Eubacterium sp.]|nr:DNA topoisomerase [Eubacterium sp.]
MSEQIIKTEFSEVMQKSYIDYAMSVICQRALPDVRDGLKPVQRRVLYAMEELGLTPEKPHRKSARIVGDTMGKYHPHGDSSIYEALVVMEQDFKKGMPLVDGHGNFGSIEGDGAAAMRYTEAKLQKFTQDVYLGDLDKNVVDFQPNFDETEKEPVVLPVRIPNLLVNGAEGIAVGMTTSIPPHNLAEVIDAVEAYMDKETIGTDELMEYIKGPDFPTGGIIVNQKELKNIYETGTGKLKLRGKVHFEPAKKRSQRDKLVITEIPYTMIGANISKFISDVVDLIEAKETTDVVDVSNESSKEGIRIVLELKKNADVDRLENVLYKKTRLEDTFGVNMLAIADGKPELLGLKDIIRLHTEFHYDILKRKYETLLAKELEQKEIKEGLIKACDIIDLIIEILRGSRNLKEAKACLMSGDTGEIRFKTQKSKKEASRLHFTAKQASAILEMRLYRLIGLEMEALQKEYEDILKKIEKYED